MARCETARLALSCCWTSSLLPTKSRNHLDAVADNLDLPAEPATACCCAHVRCKTWVRSRAPRKHQATRIAYVPLPFGVRMQAPSSPSTTAQDGSPQVASRGPLWSLGGGPPCLELLIIRPCHSLSVAPSAKASNCQRCLDAGTYGPALIAEDTRRVMATPQLRLLWHGSHSIRVTRHLCPQSKCTAARRSQLSQCHKACIHQWAATHVSSHQHRAVADSAPALR